MASPDPWNATDTLSEEVLGAMVARLEARGSDARFMGMTAEYLGAMEIAGAGRVLEIGCGTGLVARWIAAQPGFAGEVLGTDLSPDLVAAAERLAAAEGLAGRLSFAAGDSAALGLPDASFDAVVAHTLLSHVDDPQAVLAEARRLVRPGGLIGVFDGDYASQCFEEDDPEAAKANSERRTRAVTTQPRAMRRMPRYARAAGLEIVRVFPNVIADVGRADYWASAVEGFRRMGPASGLFTVEKAAAWADRQQHYSEEGVFFGACVFYGYVLKRPG